ncbi:ABC transporter substrate-binding protein [Pelagibacterium halotolerans]|uniref:Cobalamin/Fe3+-siderophores transport systems, secreted component n=1 Tax=Pelagibacterium halotolerans (strain DSM 22347 / JCM 15775 / CGMCC 1.7692 / B2) TaxID=1082931 RepID=G4R8B6_PELHB|nr:ABC transporter substrate-binding protein [Pelagibacterium halotolerans]AEQ52360.1 cobalamin/Fe3+-siderophores transport systems, secreted component [Pelagibacterium halotolerans B2]QJR17901.1 ABC transporter substrate-binding protein [Pelagibacterium halotolerans]SEA34274.1 iron complex transport system substrate-binding protein [Pelagibacterium halotolerans]
MKFITLTALLTASAFSLQAAPALAQEFPLTIEHKFGTTVLDEKPARVVSIDFGGIDNILALGLEPLAVRQWRVQDGFRFTAGPWAEPFLTTEPLVLEGDLDFEAIAAQEPDVIIGLYSGISGADYEKLSLIAPVVAVPEGVGDYALAWDQRALLAGRALGEEAEALARIEAIDTQLETIRTQHPEWADMTAVVGGFREGGPWAYTRYDVRGQFLEGFGFQLPDALNAVSKQDEFYIEGSPEDIAMIDADVAIWYGGGEYEEIRNSPALPFLHAYETGGEIYLPDHVVAAFARVSLLSLPVAIEALVPMIEAAADGDPETVVADAR